MKGLKILNWKYCTTIFFYVVVLNICFQFYAYATSFPDVDDFIKSKQMIVISFMMCVALLSISTVYLALFSPFRIITKILLYSLTLVCLVSIFFWNQGAPQPGSKTFEYGYYSSRGVILLYFCLTLIVLCVIYPNLLLFRHFRRVAKILWIICGIIFFVMTIIGLYHYMARVSYFRKGLFGLSLDPSQTNCRVDDNTFLISHYLPKSFFHIIFLTYWCKKDVLFTELVKPLNKNPKMSQVKIHLKRCKGKEIEISKIPNIVEYHSWDDMKSVKGDHPYFSLLQYSIRDKMETEVLQISKNDRKKGVLVYEYDSQKYETIYVSCSGKRNVVVAPKRSRIKNRKLKNISTDKKPNIIMLYFDSLSRKDFERAFPKTIKFIKSISQYSRNNNNKKIDFYQFFNFKSVGSNTYRNMQAFMNGEKKDNKFPIFEEAKKEGYVTIYSDSLCNEYSTLYNHVGSLAGKNKDKMYLCDYIHLEPTCDPSYTSMETFYDPLKGSSGSCRRCLFQKKNAFELVLDYGRSLENLFPNNPKWMYLGSMDAHEATGESITYIDKPLSEYLKFLDLEGVLEKSIIIFLGDHGNIIHFIQNTFKEGNVEGRHPVLNIAFPKNFLSKDQKKKIEVNQHRLVGHFDIHRTMMDLIGASKDSLGYSQNKVGLNLYDTEVPKNRDCVGAGIPNNHICDVVCEK